MPGLRNEGVPGGVADAIYSKTKKDFGVALQSWEGKGIHQGLVWGRGGERGEELSTRASNLLNQHHTEMPQARSEELQQMYHFQNLLLHKNQCCHYSENPISPTLAGS